MNQTFNRRTFLKTAFGVTSYAALRSLLPFPPSLLAAYPDEFRRDGGLVVIPSRGTLFIATDFHARFSDFNLWLTQTNLLERMKAGEDVYGIILGDVVDRKEGDLLAEKEGDIKIIQKIREIQNTHGDRGKRLVYLSGNHEYHSTRFYHRLKTQQGMTDANRHELIQKLYDGKDGDMYRQFNSIERQTDDISDYLFNLPVAAMTKKGIVCAHGGPSRSIRDISEIVSKNKTVVEELLKGRPVPVKDSGYTPDHLSHFLGVMEQASLLVCGHTPLDLLPESWIKNGIGVFGDHEIILGTSYNALDSAGGKHLRLDLSKRYDNASALTPQKEILDLFGSRITALKSMSYDDQPTSFCARDSTSFRMSGILATAPGSPAPHARIT